MTNSPAQRRPYPVHRRPWRVALLCALVCVLAVRALNAQATPTPDSEPEVLKTPTGITEVGVLTNAEYRIDVPSNWNRGLVVFYHGFSERPFRYRLDGSIGLQAEPMLRRGYAVIQSGYSETGWALQQAFPETDALRHYFIGKYGNPRETIAAGGSMGGALVMITMELNPKNVYTAGLDLCGAVGPSYIHLNRRFLWRAAFDYYFPGIMPQLDPVPSNFEESDALRNRVVAAMKLKPDGAAAMRNLTGLHSDIEVARAVGYYTYIIGDLQHKAGGNPFSNRNTIYVGTSPDTKTDYALNDGVRRYDADPRARNYLLAHYSPSGRLTRPMLALHTVYDPLIPANTLALYDAEVTAAGFGPNLVQQYVHREGHCTFTADEVGRAFDELVHWAHTGQPPQPGLLH